MNDAPTTRDQTVSGSSDADDAHPHGELDPDVAVLVDLTGLQAGVEALASMDPAEVAEPAARIADALSRALDEEDR